ncbi:MAG: nucleotidyltransferase domain-containing protein [Saccharolobus sp.]|uniref:nucleotidyltransferase domain-containing protein n=1 Tax=Saccharolobus sp. TaxID=2100761 RepID=UPI00317CD4C6
MEVIKRREEKRREVIENARKWASSLNFRTSAILIGSYARGDFNLWSDVDIVIISDTFKENPLERLKKIDPPPGFQIIPLNLEELEKLHNKKDILAREILEHGVILRDDLQLRHKLLFLNKSY